LEGGPAAVSITATASRAQSPQMWKKSLLAMGTFCSPQNEQRGFGLGGGDSVSFGRFQRGRAVASPARRRRM
jgi:hypothetical protein